MATRINIYFNEETLQKFSEIKAYLLADVGESLERPGQKQSATVVKLIDVFYKLFLETEDKQHFSERLSRLEKNLVNLELTNFHAITKGSDFDIQDLESVHSRFDPAQHELMARIDDIIKEDVARGQTIKNSH